MRCSTGSLLAAVRASPYDDNPRLAYADRLDAKGLARHAEFIRVQCEIARLAAAAEVRGDNPYTDRMSLLLQCQAALAPGAFCGGKPLVSRSSLLAEMVVATTDNRVRISFRRGFVDELRAPGADLDTLPRSVAGPVGRVVPDGLGPMAYTDDSERPGYMRRHFDDDYGCQLSWVWFGGQVGRTTAWNDSGAGLHGAVLPFWLFQLVQGVGGELAGYEIMSPGSAPASALVGLVFPHVDHAVDAFRKAVDDWWACPDRDRKASALHAARRE